MWGKALTFLFILCYLLIGSGIVPQISEAELDQQFVPQFGPFIQIWDDAGDNVNPSVAYNPLHDEYLVVWVTKQGEFSWDIWGRRLRGDGSPIPDGWFNIDNVAGLHLVDPALVYNPHTDQYLVVYTAEISINDHDIWGKLVNWNGGLSSRLYIDNRSLKQTDPAVVYNNQEHQYLIAYSDWQASGSVNVYLQTLNENGSGIDNAAIVSGSGEYRGFPDVAYDAEYNRYLIVYSNEGPFLPRILGKTVSADLSSFSPDFHYNDDNVLGYEAEISCGLKDCLVVWSGGFAGYVKARRVSHDATPLGPTGGFEIAGVIKDVIQRNPNVSIFNPWGYLVTWDYFVTTTADHGDVYGRVVAFGRDKPMDLEFPIDDRKYFEGDSSLACDPTGSCLLVDKHNPLEYPAGDYEINGRLVLTLRNFIPLIMR
jgi:hypothetical protein